MTDRPLPRKTVSRDVVFQGRCLHGGQAVTAVLHPSSDGIAFSWNGERTLAIPANVAETTRCTRLGPISTIEHLMAALAVAGVTDVEVELDQPELPAMDGCSEVFYNGICEAGLEDTGTLVVKGLFARVFASNQNAKLAVAAGTGHWRYTLDTGAKFPGILDTEFLDVVEAFPADIAPARTFGFESELRQIQEMGLAQGLDLSQALLLGETGYVNEPRFPDEPARHKILDLVGDLYLAGLPPSLLNVSAERSGHTLNIEAASRLAEAIVIERVS